MKLTKSQVNAIENQKRIMRIIHNDVSFEIKLPDNKVRFLPVLMCSYTIAGVMENCIQCYANYAIGKRGKVIKTYENIGGKEVVL